MVDNAKNTKYIVPYIRRLRSRLNDIPDLLDWEIEEEGMHPKIEGDVITLHGETHDTIRTHQRFNIDSNHGLVFQCHLPGYESYDQIAYFAGNCFGGWLYQGRIYLFGGEITFQNYPYKQGDFYQQIYDGTFVNFYLNGKLLQRNYISDCVDDDYEQIYFGVGYGDYEPTVVTFTHVYVYQTGISGVDGTHGIDCNTFLSNNQVLTNIPTSLANYGKIGDYYIDKATNKLYGPKLGLCGSAFFDRPKYYNAQSNLLSIVNSADFRMGTGDFTVEWFQYTVDSLNSRIFSINSLNSGLSLAPSIAVSIEGGGNPQTFYLWINGGIHNMGQVNVFNTWTHFAVVRSNTGSGGLYTVYKNGESMGNTFTGTDNLNDTTHALTIGGEAQPDGNTFYGGYITNFRWSKGIARYTTNFTPSYTPLTAIDSNTKLLLNMVDYAHLITDSSGLNQTVTNYNATSWNVNTPFKSIGTWVEPTIPRDPKPFFVSLQGGGTTSVLNMTNFNSVLIYLGFAHTNDVKAPSNLVLVAVNKSSSNVLNYVLFDQSNLPTDVSLSAPYPVFQINSSGSNPSYLFVSVKVLVIS
jgi:hypothetical protein